ncbi:hypothetical protein PPTG_23740 [Phytophthora nicotianae INRA-310]|uniref:Uncharacterized protein n=1 Tax=Phytophthora nicotianae (strain INRA-310) TaxID=761204 RepID=W2PSV5_PHYN3|nr:hypothetical protein PPTG_23740 [Phytophthora nicotianae INRA-310]ETN03726.1 hypothetical protein PPTG_23740 [Phytophthora nicotianae INRA-310]
MGSVMSFFSPLGVRFTNAGALGVSFSSFFFFLSLLGAQRFGSFSFLTAPPFFSARRAFFMAFLLILTGAGGAAASGVGAESAMFKGLDGCGNGWQRCGGAVLGKLITIILQPGRYQCLYA